MQLSSFILKRLLSSIDADPELEDLLEAVVGGDHVVQLCGGFAGDDFLKCFDVFVFGEIMLHSIFVQSFPHPEDVGVLVLGVEDADVVLEVGAAHCHVVTFVGEWSSLIDWHFKDSGVLVLSIYQLLLTMV